MTRHWAMVFGAYWAALAVCWWLIAKTHNDHQYRWMWIFVGIAAVSALALLDAWLVRRRMEREERHR